MMTVELNAQERRRKRLRFDPWVRKIPWRQKWQPTPVFLPGKSHGQGRLAGYSPWDCKETRAYLTHFQKRCDYYIIHLQ